MRFIFLIILLSVSVQAHFVADKPATILTNLDQARAVGALILSKDEAANLAVSYVDELQMQQISQLNHFLGRCAGFEVLSETEAQSPGFALKQLQVQNQKILNAGIFRRTEVEWNESYQKLADQANPSLLRETVTWISSYPHRFNKADKPNQHVEDLEKKLRLWLEGAQWPYKIDFISHTSTRQKSLRLSIPGKLRPEQVVVLGGHFDSINSSFFGGSLAPGADDNASGSANLIEAVKILKNSDQPERTLEFYWYAGEESGLLGSGEIAKEAKSKGRNIVGVLQLDMTLFPGSGEQVIGMITDFTSPWLRDVLGSINSQYVKARFIDDECGYACSDHASWHRQGYHAVTPFESTSSTMNRKIHTESDVINGQSNFEHSNSFTKYAVLFALTLGNSEISPPVF